MQFLIDYIGTPIFVFLIGYLLVRFAGQKSVSQMNSFDIMIILIVGTSISEPIVSKNNWISAWYSFLVILTYVGLSRLVLNNKFKTVLTYSPIVLIQDGKIKEKGLKKARMNVELLLGTLRVEGYSNVADIKLAMMEESGDISVIPKSDKRPLQPSDIQLSPSPAFVSIPLIIDGEVINHNLKFLNKSLDWLYQKMQTNNMGKDDLDKIALATYNQQGIVDFHTTIQNIKENNNPYQYRPGNES
ncbi:DUF421 domain-containing protein [Pseudogracilibacillus sp. SO30301A]|uniref:DUF421 domain-containing protein n=1 Tax=Pseudogracilibacillus sp. SO30301A TaxID=3098291 RepID=UPI00300E3280